MVGYRREMVVQHRVLVLLLLGFGCSQPQAVPITAPEGESSAGWILMGLGMAEVGPDLYALGDERPVREWHALQAFDTAAACERARAREKEERNRDMLSDRAMTGNAMDTALYSHRGSLLVILWLHADLSRCVPAEYIYPPERP